MILFYQDWFKYPEAIMDTKTKNRSFYLQAIKYKLMGIKNHGWHLALLDPSLQGVDPLDEDNLTSEQKEAIIVEILRNPMYYWREIIQVGSSGGGIGHLQANRGNLALFWLFLNHIFTILIQIRQSGKSLNTDALKSYPLYFGALKTTIAFLVNTNKNRQESLGRIKSFEKSFPKYLKVISSKDIDNMERIGIRETDNWYETSVMQASVEAARGVFRGKTVPIRHIDEGAYILNVEDSLGGMLKTGTTADDHAKAAGSLYGTIFSTTAGFKDTPHGKYVYNELYKPAAVFEESMYDRKDIDDLEKFIRERHLRKELKVLIEMNHRQLGKTDSWLARKIEETMSRGVQTLTDYFNVWSDSKGEPLLSEDDIKKISMSKSVYTDTQIYSMEGYTIRWFITEEERRILKSSGEALVAGMDTSEALGGDDISLVIRKVSTGEVIGAGNYNETNTTIFGMFVAELLIEWTNMTIVIERKSTGVSIIDSIVPILMSKNINPLLRLFNWAVNDMHLSPKHKAVYDELMRAFARRDRTVFDRHKKLFGFSTSGGGRTARNKLYSDTFKSAIKYVGSTVRDGLTISQILDLKNINGRVDHDSDGNDDMVIGWLLSFWLLRSGSNLSQYGMNINRVLISIKETIFKDGEKDLERMKKLTIHNRAMDRITKLTEIVSNSENELEVREAKQVMKKLGKFIDYTQSPSFNIDIHLSKIEQDRRLKIKLAS